jgi:dTDP-glucose pyrophosphorylase
VALKSAIDDRRSAIGKGNRQGQSARAIGKGDRRSARAIGDLGLPMGDRRSSTMSAISKAVVMARGLGTRMREAGTPSLTPEQARAADAGHKAMMPLVDSGARAPKVLLDYVLSALGDAGFGSVCLVIGPEHDDVRRYYTGMARPHRLHLDFAIQQKPRGTADAVAAAAQFVGAEECLVINGDNYYPVSALSAIRTLDEPGVVLHRVGELVTVSDIPRERLAAFALCTVTRDGYLDSIVEKPGLEAIDAAGEGAMVSMNCWRISPVVMRACAEVTPSSRGELELADAIRLAMTRYGVRFRVVISREGVLDLSRRTDVEAVAARLRDVVADP